MVPNLHGRDHTPRQIGGQGARLAKARRDRAGAKAFGKSAIVRMADVKAGRAQLRLKAVALVSQFLGPRLPAACLAPGKKLGPTWVQILPN
jgi:hypothetical protein